MMEPAPLWLSQCPGCREDPGCAPGRISHSQQFLLPGLDLGSRVLGSVTPRPPFPQSILVGEQNEQAETGKAKQA